MSAPSDLGVLLYFVHPPAHHMPRKIEVLRDYLAAHFAKNPLG